MHEIRSQVYTQGSKIQAKIRQTLTSPKERDGRILWDWQNGDQETVFGAIHWPHHGWLLVIGRHWWLFMKH